MQNRIGFEAKVISVLEELKKSQKESDDKRLMFETRMETKWEMFVKDMRQGGQGQDRGQSRSEHVKANVDNTPSPDYEDFEKLDESFPVKFEGEAEELEWNVKKDLNFKLRLVIYLSNF